MAKSSGEVKISYGDSSHPRDLLKNLKHKRKQLQLVLKGKFTGFTADEEKYYRSLSYEQIDGLIYQYTERIKGMKKGFRSQGKAISNNTLDHLRSGQSSLRYSGLYAPPSMNPVVKADKTDESKKKESEEL